jgi:hypothetical protein
VDTFVIPLSGSHRAKSRKAPFAVSGLGCRLAVEGENSGCHDDCSIARKKLENSVVGQFDGSVRLNHMSAKPAPASARNTGRIMKRNAMSFVSLSTATPKGSTASIIAKPRKYRRTRISHRLSS